MPDPEWPDAVRWIPELSGEAREYLEQLRGETRPAIEAQAKKLADIAQRSEQIAEADRTSGVEWRPNWSPDDEAKVEALTAEFTERAQIWRAMNAHLNIDPLTAHNAIAGRNDGYNVNITGLHKLASAAGGELVFALRNRDGETMDLKKIYGL